MKFHVKGVARKSLPETCSLKTLKCSMNSYVRGVARKVRHETRLFKNIKMFDDLAC